MLDYEKIYRSILKIRKHSYYTARIIFVIAVILVASVAMNIYSVTRVENLQSQMNEMKDQIEDTNEANKEVLAMLENIRDTQQKQNKALEISLKNKAIKKQQQNNVILLKTNGVSRYTDLSQNNNISVEDMDKIINYYSKKIKGGSRFKGKGYAFVEAAKESGLNPIYIFAHAACESGFGNSAMAREKNNFFGIAAYDNNPNASYYMGSSIDEGIINGAVWIKKNYYEEGMITLDAMSKTYASDPKWASSIVHIMNESIQVI